MRELIIKCLKIIFCFFLFVLFLNIISCANPKKFLIDHVTMRVYSCGTAPRYDLIDKEKGIFCVTATKKLFEIDKHISKGEPASIHSDAIKYAIIEYGRLNQDFIFLDRVIEATKMALFKHGKANVYCYFNNNYYWFALAYEPGEKHMIFYNYTKESLYPTVNAVDFSSVNVSIKKTEQ